MCVFHTTQIGYFGENNWYRGSGYTVDMPIHNSSFTSASSTLTHMRTHGFIDESTRALFIDMQTFNPSLNYHFIARYVFEMPASGGVQPSFHTQVCVCVCVCFCVCLCIYVCLICDVYCMIYDACTHIPSLMTQQCMMHV